jgi:MATE family multidrug resistance protein
MVKIDDTNNLATPLIPKERKTSFISNIPEIVTYSVVIYNLLPNVANSIMYFFIGLIETHFIGKTKDLNLMDGVGLGILYNNVIFYFLGIGLIESMAVTLPKAFGKKDFRLLGIQTNQVRIMISIFFLIFVIINIFFSKDLLNLIAGEDKSYVDTAHYYVIWVTPSLFIDLQFEIYSKYTESQLNYNPVIYSFVFSFLSHIISCYYLIEVQNLGVLGCVLATNLTNLVKIGVILIHIYFFNPYPQSNFFWDKKIFEHKSLLLMIKVSVLSMLTYFSECAGYSISNIVANKLSKVSYAKYIVLSNISMLNYSICYGWMNTASILISNYIGENSPKNVRNSIKYLSIIAIFVEIPLIASIYFFKREYLLFFSEDEGISLTPDMTDYYIYILMAFMALDLTQAFLVGVLRGCEILDLTTSISTGLFLVFHPIFSYITAIVYGWDIFGIILSEMIVYTILSICWLYYYLYKLDFVEICLKYKEENYSEDEDEIDIKNIKEIKALS